MYYAILGSVYIEQFFENKFCSLEEAHRIGNDLNSENMEIELFAFSVEASQFSKSQESEFKRS